MRVGYWTTASLERGIEAVSNEVFELAGHFPRSTVFGVSPHVVVRAGREPLHLGLHPRFNAFLRLAFPMLELMVDVNHVYSEVSPWLFEKTLSRRPIVLTIASEKGKFNPSFLDRVRAITVQTEGMRLQLSQVARWRAKTTLIYPGVDLARYFPSGTGRGTISNRRPRVLLATFPRSKEELEARGLLFLLEAARLNPHVDIDILTRPWSTGETACAVIKRHMHAAGLTNFRLLFGRRERMEDLYREYDFTVIPYARPDGGKECPLSLVEGLACGVPVLISRVAPFSAYVAQNGCGAVFDLDPRSFGAALNAALSDYERCRGNAIACAREHFDRRLMFKQFASLYGTDTHHAS